MEFCGIRKSLWNQPTNMNSLHYRLQFCGIRLHLQNPFALSKKIKSVFWSQAISGFDGSKTISRIIIRTMMGLKNIIRGDKKEIKIINERTISKIVFFIAQNNVFLLFRLSKKVSNLYAWGFLKFRPNSQKLTSYGHRFWKFWIANQMCWH